MEPLPVALDPRKAALREAVICGSVTLTGLSRFAQALATDEGLVKAQLAFSRDQENRYIVVVTVSASVVVTCQRCLEPMPLELSATNHLAVVGDEEQAAQLPTQLEPLLVPGEECKLWEVVEDELILSLPFASYHDTEACKETLRDFNASAEPAAPEAERPNPFEVLEQLKPGPKE